MLNDFCVIVLYVYLSECSSLHILVFSSHCVQIQALKVLVNLSSNPDIMDDIVQAQVKYAEINIWFSPVNSSGMGYIIIIKLETNLFPLLY